MERGVRINRGDVPKIILGTIGVAGLLTVAVVAPNALQSLALIYGRGKPNIRRGQVKTTLGRLKEKGMIEFVEHKGRKVVRLTDKGKRELLKYQTREDREKKRWDGKWRIVMFDIAETRRRTRDLLRKELLSFGFVQLQKSVWVYPFECDEFISLLKADMHVGKDILYMIADRVEGDMKLKKKFGLK